MKRNKQINNENRHIFIHIFFFSKRFIYFFTSYFSLHPKISCIYHPNFFVFYLSFCLPIPFSSRFTIMPRIPHKKATFPDLQSNTCWYSYFTCEFIHCHAVISHTYQQHLRNIHTDAIHIGDQRVGAFSCVVLCLCSNLKMTVD